MYVARTKLISRACLILSFVAVLAAFGQPAQAQVSPGNADSTVVDALKSGKVDLAEENARSQLQKFESAGEQPSMEKRKAQTALATVLAAKAWEADNNYRSKRITGSDVVFLIVIVLLAGSILALILRYGPQRPKVIDKTVQWLGKVKRENQDDGFKQTGSALFSLLILAVFGLLLFGGLTLTMRIVASLDSTALQNPQAKKYFDEAKTLMEAARATEQSTEPPPAKYEDFDVLSLYSQFLHKVGNDKLSNAVALRAIALRNTCGRINLKQKPPVRYN